jgi:hypothetical protein
MNFYLMMLSFTLIALLTGYCAQRRGRDPKIWFVIGFLFGLFGLAALFLISKQEIKPVKLESLVVEPTPPAEVPQIVHQTREWFYLDKEHKQFGPTTFENLKEKFDAGAINSSTYVWTEGMDEWKRIKEKQDFWANDAR